MISVSDKAGAPGGTPAQLLDEPGTLRVLIVDDYREAADSQAMLLRLWGHEVRVAYNGPAALALARVWQPDVVLSLGLYRRRR